MNDLLARAARYVSIPSVSGNERALADEVERDPLRVTGFAGEGFRQIGIAFPVSARIAVGQARIAIIIGIVVGIAPPGQPVSP